MLKSINPSMLLLARESRGLSQSELANQLNISQGKLSKAEKGAQTLDFEMLSNLSKITNYPISFFHQASPDSPVSHHYYRRKISVPKKTINQIEANIKIFRKNIDELMDAIELPEYSLPSINSDDKRPEEIAELIRYKLKVTQGPMPNLVNLLENHGIVIVKTDMFTNKIDGLSTISDRGVKIVFLNKRMSTDRQRFSLAHELGHLIMHFDIPSYPENIEEEANRFASELLMPKKEINNDLRFLTFSKLGDLKRHWKVSMRALVYRAKTLETINQRQYRNFQINFSRRGINKSEPIKIADEKAFILNRVIDLHQEELGYSLDELAKIVHLNPVEFRDNFIQHNPTKLTIVRNDQR